MAGSGHLTGRFVKDSVLIDSIIDGLVSLIEPAAYMKNTACQMQTLPCSLP